MHGEQVLWPSREFSQEGKPVELLLFLAASSPDGVDRDAVVEAMWPDADMADPGSSLRQLRSRIRRLISRVVVQASDQAPFLPDLGRAHRLDPEVVRSDVHRFVEMSRRAGTGGTEAIPLLEQTRALYTGDLFDSSAAPPFSWAIDPGIDGTSLQQRYRQISTENTRLLADLYLKNGEPRQTLRAIALYEELRRADPLDEDVSRALLKALAIRGDRTASEREWRRLSQSLRSADPTAKPLLETTELYQRLTRES